MFVVDVAGLVDVVVAVAVVVLVVVVAAVDSHNRLEVSRH